MADIFISYAHEDKEFVVALHDALARAGRKLREQRSRAMRIVFARNW